MVNFESKEEERSFFPKYVVGIGASAGGLDALNELFDNMPTMTGFAFVVVQHLSPEHKSLMAELLSKHTEMQVFEAMENMAIRPNCIYLIPPAKLLTLNKGLLKLEEKLRDRQPNTAVDIFFESLAEEYHEKAIAIILSGTGTDGTKGIQSIKNNGGTVIVQDPLSAQFDGMPNSAVGSGYVDMILSPDMMPEELLEFIEQAPLLRSFTSLSNQEEALRLDILDLIYKTTGHDFSNYKKPTINRRLAKRMMERNMNALPEYYQYLVAHPDEVRKLCKEFLLHVTRFFRDEEAFGLLKKNVIPVLLGSKKPGDTVKGWSVACSTGQEAYSLAILFDECMEELRIRDIEVKIFASDISQDVIEFASRGVYSEDEIVGISPERLKKYFVRESGVYRIVPFIRKMIVFAKHDICKDPPFSRIDLISCRNMLIYMNPLLQKVVLQKFHFAVNDDGYIFLGASENAGSLKDVLSEVDRKWKIFKCISKAKVSDSEPFINPADRPAAPPFSLPGKSKNALHNLSDIFKETLLEEYDYAGIFIDKDFEVKQAIGNFKKFLDFPEGHFNFNLLKMVPTDLSIALSSGIRKAIHDNERGGGGGGGVVQKNISVSTGSDQRRITIIIKPYIIQKTYLQPFIFVVLKEEETAGRKSTNFSQESGGIPSEVVAELQQELHDTKENLQALVEELESANEELQSSNEEIISSNEELQSTNEELQSLNEELHTVSAEHQLKIKELIELNDDMNNYFRNSDIGQIIIDKKLIIRKFTPVATRQVNLISSDIGRSIVDISTNMTGLNFINSIKSVLQTGEAVEEEIEAFNNKAFLMRIAPYLKQNKTIDGVVVNFIDITEIKKLNSMLQAIFNSSSSGIAAMKVLKNDKEEIIDFIFLSNNIAAHQLLGVKESIAGKSFQELFPNAKEAFEKYSRVAQSGDEQIFESFNEHTKRWFEIVAVRMQEGILITFNDITDKKVSAKKIEQNYHDLKSASEEISNTNRMLEQSNFDLMQFASVASHDLKEPLRKIQVFGNILQDKVSNKLSISEAKNLEKIISSSNRMQILIDDVLTLSRLSKNDTPHTEVDLNGVVSQIIDDLEISISERDARIKLSKLPVVKGVSGQLHQLFQNLISNSIKFNLGQPIVSIESCERNVEKELGISVKDYHCISIKDNGIGFEEQFSEKIFGVFQRLEKNNYQGTGIGLAIVKKIVDNHQGFIKAYSAPGEGSEFIILLPK